MMIGVLLTVIMNHVNPITVTLADVRHVNSRVLNLARYVSIAACCLVTLLSGYTNRYWTEYLFVVVVLVVVVVVNDSTL